MSLPRRPFHPPPAKSCRCLARLLSSLATSPIRRDASLLRLGQESRRDWTRPEERRAFNGRRRGCRSCPMDSCPVSKFREIALTDCTGAIPVAWRANPDCSSANQTRTASAAAQSTDPGTQGLTSALAVPRRSSAARGVGGPGPAWNSRAGPERTTPLGGGAA